MADEVENDDQWLYGDGDNPDTQDNPSASTENRPEETPEENNDQCNIEVNVLGIVIQHAQEV